MMQRKFQSVQYIKSEIVKPFEIKHLKQKKKKSCHIGVQFTLKTYKIWQSQYTAMYNDVCYLTLKKRITFITLSFCKWWISIKTNGLSFPYSIEITSLLCIHNLAKICSKLRE